MMHFRRMAVHQRHPELPVPTTRDTRAWRADPYRPVGLRAGDPIDGTRMVGLAVAGGIALIFVGGIALLANR